jgi:release factor glutamine methyltransferase
MDTKTAMDFHGVRLLTAPGRVMTPRPATEALVDRALELVGDGPVQVADVGTGSGAIAVSLALLAPHATVWATDLSPAAVELARANVERLGLQDRVQILEGDLLEPAPEGLDLVVANLPYLPAREAAAHPELEGEPVAAVFAAGDGLGPLSRLFEQAYDRLRAGGSVVYQYRGEVFEARREELPLLQSPAWRALATRS